MVNKDLREKQITKTSFIGVGANVLLAAFKATVGLIAGSVAIVLDAVNNLTDALSSIITVIGVKLAKRPPDKKHPYGHGRIEYFSAVIIAAIVISAGVTSFIESVKKIIEPGEPSYSTVTLIVIIAAIVTKLILGRYVRSQGIKYNSDALTAAGSDALFDAILSFATLVSAVIMLIWNFSADGIIGVLISGFIIKAGIEMLLKPINRIVGVREDSEVTKGIRADIAEIEGVDGVYDLILHNYGPDYAIGSVHIEIPDTVTAKEIHELTGRIQSKIFLKYSVFLTVGIYAIDTRDEELAEMRSVLRKLAEDHDGVINTHGFLIKKDEKKIFFDIVVDFNVRDRATLVEHIKKDVEEAYPGFSVFINVDSDFSD
ncbi:MAG: cation transporter [Clostridia bacterium]|nr:cation transporter [Clostridia bacterium]